MNAFERASGHLARFGVLPGMLMVGVEIGSGILRRVNGGMIGLGRHDGLHNWLSHAMVIYFWLLAPVVLAWAIAAWMHRLRLRALCGVVCSGLTAGSVLLTAFSGYIPTVEHGEGALARFVVLHFVLLPAASLAGLMALLAVLRIPAPRSPA